MIAARAIAVAPGRVSWGAALLAALTNATVCREVAHPVANGWAAKGAPGLLQRNQYACMGARGAAACCGGGGGGQAAAASAGQGSRRHRARGGPCQRSHVAGIWNHGEK